MIIGDAIQRFCDDRKLYGLSLSSVNQYCLQLNAFARWLNTHNIFDTESIASDHARSFLCDERPRLKQWTLCGKRSVLKIWLDWLQNNNLSTADSRSLPHICPPKADEIRRVIVNDREASVLINYAKKQYRRFQTRKSLQDVVLVAILFGMGLRISEVAAIKIKHINILRRELSIPKSKGNIPRYAAIPPSTIGIIRYFLWKVKPNPNEKLLTHNGKSYAPKSLARRVQRLGYRAGVFLTSHTGRRFCISHLAYTNVLIAKKQAGHKRLETTMLYVEESREELRRTLRTHDPLRQAM